MMLRDVVMGKARLDAVGGVVARDREIVPVGAMELWWVKRAPVLASLSTRSGATSATCCM
jgi:hypothetical protein